MKEELTNLTPEMVEELRELGIEFEDTQDVWIKFSNKADYQRMSHDKANKDPLIFHTAFHAVPCPNLQEVLDKLPTAFYVEHGLYSGVKGFFFNLYPVGNIADRHWVAAYSYPNEPNKISFSYINPLIAAFELLKWVATNHPESLTDKKDKK